MENLDARAIAALWSPNLNRSGCALEIISRQLLPSSGAGATIPGGKEREGYALIGIKGSQFLRKLQNWLLLRNLI